MPARAVPFGELYGRAVVLDHRFVPGTKTPIDHVVVAPSGVWVIDSRDISGRVERRNFGGWFSVDERLYVAGQDRTALIDEVDRQVVAVEQALTNERLNGVPVHAAVCFTNATWRPFAKPFALTGVWVTPADKVTGLVMGWDPCQLPPIERLAAALAARLPAAA